jgi:hypothetical protein
LAEARLGTLVTLLLLEAVEEAVVAVLHFKTT